MLTRRDFVKNSSISFAIPSLFGKSSFESQLSEIKTYLTTGMKIGEVTDNSAIILIRISATDTPNPMVHDRTKGPICEPVNFEQKIEIADMDGEVAGTEGQARIILTAPDKTIIISNWKKAVPEKDYNLKFIFTELMPYTNYEIEVESCYDNKGKITKLNGGFRTAPMPDQVVPIFCASTSCQQYWDYDDPERGFKIYDSMSRMNLDFFVHTGDYVYYDRPGPVAVSKDLARYKWHRMNSFPSLVDFYRKTPSYFIKDDHDTLKDDCHPYSSPLGELAFADAVSVWYENIPLFDKPYRTFRWGKDLQIWLIEGREYRSNNLDTDSSSKTILGNIQKDWLVKTMSGSDATFKILFSPTPVVGPDRDNKKDNHSNKNFADEGNWLRRFLAKQGAFVVNGDRHWQYVSVDSETGLREYSQGPASDSHAQGWKPDDIWPEHRFLRVAGGYVAVKVQRKNDRPQIEFIHYDVDGNQVNIDCPK